ncbi:MAG: hypothetical protein ACE5JM_06990 [Armatimonadota bacterium]
MGKLVALAAVLAVFAIACGPGEAGVIAEPPSPGLDSETPTAEGNNSVSQIVGSLPEGRLLLLPSGVSNRGAPELSALTKGGDLVDLGEAHNVMPSPDGRLVATVYWQTEDGPVVFAVRTVEGEELFRLSDDSPDSRLSFWNLAWSPDSESLALTIADESQPGSTDIWVMNADGSDRRRLTAEPGSYGIIAWAADGEHLVATRWIQQDERSELLSIDRRTGEGLTIDVPGAGGNESYQLSPDGRRLAFYVGDFEAGFDLWVMDVDGSNARRLTSLGSFARRPPDDLYVSALPPGRTARSAPSLLLKGLPPAVWSPDGRRIAYIRFVEVQPSELRMTSTDLHVVSLDGADLKIAESADWNFAWSPDGRLIAASVDGELMVADLQGKCQSFQPFIDEDGRSLEVARGAHLPVWSPSGEYLVFVTEGAFSTSASNGIYTVRRDGSNVRLLGRSTGILPLAWLPE